MMLKLPQLVPIMSTFSMSWAYTRDTPIKTQKSFHKQEPRDIVKKPSTKQEVSFLSSKFCFQH